MTSDIYLSLLPAKYSCVCILHSPEWFEGFQRQYYYVWFPWIVESTIDLCVFVILALFTNIQVGHFHEGQNCTPYNSSITSVPQRVHCHRSSSQFCLALSLLQLSALYNPQLFPASHQNCFVSLTNTFFITLPSLKMGSVIFPPASARYNLISMSEMGKNTYKLLKTLNSMIWLISMQIIIQAIWSRICMGKVHMPYNHASGGDVCMCVYLHSSILNECHGSYAQKNYLMDNVWPKRAELHSYSFNLCPIARVFFFPLA